MTTAQGMVTFAVAKKMVANRIKGNAAFKPDHGEHGQCSWFVSSGNPYTGITPGKNIPVKVTVNDWDVVKDDQIVMETLASFKEHERSLRQTNRREFDLKLWNSIGDQLRRRRPAVCSNILVPQGEVSQQGSGYFLVVPPFAAFKLQVTNWDDLEQIVNAREPNFLANYQLTEKIKNETLSATLTVVIGPCADSSLLNKYRGQLNAGRGALFKAIAGPPTTKMVSVTSGWGNQKKDVPRYFATDQLMYANFRDARNAFKALVALAAHINSQLAREEVVKVFGGDNWSDKQSSLYTAPNQARMRFGH